jgi:hypothetical protein
MRIGSLGMVGFVFFMGMMMFSRIVAIKNEIQGD